MISKHQYVSTVTVSEISQQKVKEFGSLDTVVDADWRTGASTAVLPVLLDLHVKGTE